MSKLKGKGKNISKFLLCDGEQKKPSYINGNTKRDKPISNNFKNNDNPPFPWRKNV